jgi:hypothetical protein
MQSGSTRGRGAKVEVFPNPFRNETKISFLVEEDSNAVVEVYTLQGSRVATLYEGQALAEETYTVTFSPDGIVSRQVYLVVVRTDYGMTTRQILSY